MNPPVEKWHPQPTDSELWNMSKQQNITKHIRKWATMDEGHLKVPSIHSSIFYPSFIIYQVLFSVLGLWQQNISHGEWESSLDWRIWYIGPVPCPLEGSESNHWFMLVPLFYKWKNRSQWSRNLPKTWTSVFLSIEWGQYLSHRGAVITV